MGFQGWLEWAKAMPNAIGAKVTTSESIQLTRVEVECHYFGSKLFRLEPNRLQ